MLALVEYLSANADTAAVQSITVTYLEQLGFIPERLCLPTAQLHSLQELRLRGINVPAPPTPGAPSTCLDAALTALTSLELRDCWAELDCLASFSTRLRRLALEGAGIGSQIERNIAAVAAAIPQLLALTALTLTDSLCIDTTVAHISRLTRLQELKLTGWLAVICSRLQPHLQHFANWLGHTTYLCGRRRSQR